MAPYNLFLDDLRDPYEAHIYTHDTDYLDRRWDVVRNHGEFCGFIKAMYLAGYFPSLISFDHDLAPEHYTPQEYWYDYAVSKAYQDKQIYTEKTGLDCAKWLVEFCINNKLALPSFKVHSMNPVGANNIRKVLYNFKIS